MWLASLRSEEREAIKTLLCQHNPSRWGEMRALTLKRLRLSGIPVSSQLPWGAASRRGVSGLLFPCSTAECTLSSAGLGQTESGCGPFPEFGSDH